MNLTKLPVGTDPPHRIYAVVEIPRNSRNKYEYDPVLDAFRLDRVLYSAVHYPAAYGFIPSTLASDGDCLDVLVSTTEPTFSGCIIEARPIGVLRMVDEHGGDDKVLCVPCADPHFERVGDLDEISPHLLKEIEHFFRTYKDLENKHCEVFGWSGAAVARELIVECTKAAVSGLVGGNDR
jgi:inorganic pyrophosphatase